MKYILIVVIFATIAVYFGTHQPNSKEDMINSCIADGGEPDACEKANK